MSLSAENVIMTNTYIESLIERLIVELINPADSRNYGISNEHYSIIIKHILSDLIDKNRDSRTTTVNNALKGLFSVKPNERLNKHKLKIEWLHLDPSFLSITELDTILFDYGFTSWKHGKQLELCNIIHLYHSMVLGNNLPPNETFSTDTSKEILELMLYLETQLNTTCDRSAKLIEEDRVLYHISKLLKEGHKMSLDQYIRLLNMPYYKPMRSDQYYYSYITSLIHHPPLDEAIIRANVVE